MNYSAATNFDHLDLLSSDASVNPDFHDWTAVYVKSAPLSSRSSAHSPSYPSLHFVSSSSHFSSYILGRFRYCDSSSYSGYVEEPVQWQGNQMYFRGFANLDAVRAAHAASASHMCLLSPNFAPPHRLSPLCCVSRSRCPAAPPACQLHPTSSSPAAARVSCDLNCQ